MEILVRAKCQKFDALLIEDAIGEQAQLTGDPKFVYADAMQITHPGLASARDRADGPQCGIQVLLWRTMQLLRSPHK